MAAETDLRSPQQSPNHATYQKREFVERYRKAQDLFPSEEKIFRDYDRQFRGNVLDIAIGMGRTTRPLLAQASRYVGLDFSEVMVCAARKIFPAADIRVLDMRDVPRVFAGERFDAILISFNGLDYIPWEDRCTLLLALRTLLSSEGVLVFSSHDLADKEHQSGFYLRPDLAQTWKMAYRPRAFARLLLRLPRWLLKAAGNRLRNRRLEQTFDGYAYLNDSGEDYGLLTVYVSTSRQLDLLGGFGYSAVEVLQPWLRVQQDSFNYFVCRV
ncbi:MAG: class I SAM-dependent methyltransferase [Gammaproteobacteria bacterium]